MQEGYKEASGWFDGVYRAHEANYANIPWARQAVNPLLARYLHEEPRHQGRALVIGCGLGDDAHALAKAGYDVVAIDVSSKALEIAKHRFEESAILWEEQDIFEMPPKYDEAFDFVFEAFTIQSLPILFRENMVKAIAQTLAPGGKLLVVAHQKTVEFQGPPWPLVQEEMDLFKAQGLKELCHEIHSEASSVSSRRFRVIYQKEME